MSLVTDVLPILDDVRDLLDDLGFRSYSLLMRLISWSGERPGDGTKTTTDTELTLDGTHKFNAERISGHEIMASGGLYREGDWRIGPITPPFTGGGRAPSYFDPSLTGASEVYYRLTGPGMESGRWFQKIDVSVDGEFGYYFTLRAANISEP